MREMSMDYIPVVPSHTKLPKDIDAALIRQEIAAPTESQSDTANLTVLYGAILRRKLGEARRHI